ncbi:MAG: hypothetical protein ACI3ZP_01230 [Candidatus Cryptobacteroides sp.]
MILKILTTLLMAYFFLKFLRVMTSSAIFLIDGKLARQSPIFDQKFSRGFLVFLDLINVLMNLIGCLWCVLCVSEMWMKVSCPLWAIALFVLLGIYLIVTSCYNNRIIKRELHDMATNFKVIEDLPEDVQNTYGNAMRNLDHIILLIFTLLIFALIFWLK